MALGQQLQVHEVSSNEHFFTELGVGERDFSFDIRLEKQDVLCFVSFDEENLLAIGSSLSRTVRCRQDIPVLENETRTRLGQGHDQNQQLEDSHDGFPFGWKLSKIPPACESK